MPDGSNPMRLSLDAHGGDHGPSTTVPAAIEALGAEPGLQIILAGREQDVLPHLPRAQHPRLSLVKCTTVLPSDARPISILRKAQDSSLGLALQLVESGKADACVSAGSTSALMILASKYIGLTAGLRRPALMSEIPHQQGTTGVLDLGANLNADARQLTQFGVMGAVARNPANPESVRVGLLNVGHELSKGNAVIREAHERLEATRLNYVGFVEGHDIYSGRVDVAVCDGYSGNIMLKSNEGLSKLLMAELRSTLNGDLRSRLGGWLARPALRRMLARLEPGAHNGAPLLGLREVVFKSHGNADRPALTQAIIKAVRETRRHVPGKIEEYLQRFGLGEGE